MAQTGIVVCGFDPEGSFGCREPEEIWEDRLEKAFDLCELVEEPFILISGGGGDGKKPESVLMKEFAEEELERAEKYDIHTEEESMDGLENAENSFEILRNNKIDKALTVSSIDHLPRVENAWQEVNNNKINMSSVSSSKTTLKHPVYYLIYLPRLLISGEYRYYF